MRNLQRKSTESLTTSEKKVSKCVKCDKIAVIIEDNNYYCGAHYCLIKGILHLANSNFKQHNGVKGFVNLTLKTFTIYLTTIVGLDIGFGLDYAIGLW